MIWPNSAYNIIYCGLETRTAILCTMPLYIVMLYLEYVLLFRASPGVNTMPYNAYLYGINVTTTDEACKQPTNLSCNNMYRNPILDYWAILGVTKVTNSNHVSSWLFLVLIVSIGRFVGLVGIGNDDVVLSLLVHMVQQEQH